MFTHVAAYHACPGDPVVIRHVLFRLPVKV